MKCGRRMHNLEAACEPTNDRATYKIQFRFNVSWSTDTDTMIAAQSRRQPPLQCPPRSQAEKRAQVGESGCAFRRGGFWATDVRRSKGGERRAASPAKRDQSARGSRRVKARRVRHPKTRAGVLAQRISDLSGGAPPQRARPISFPITMPCHLLLA